MSNDLVSLDIVGHEFTHGVDQFSADLTYELEFGALDESFADIFGTMVEFSVQGSSGDYLIGADFSTIRDMESPNNFNQPDTYEGTNWVNVNGCTPAGGVNGNDFCGVHTNSGVQNFWFYLLAEGGIDINDNSDPYNVVGIGRDKAAAIAYRNLTTYLWSTSEYEDARYGSIWSAMDLYGECSFEVQQVINAWDAVGVYNSNLVYGFDIDCSSLNIWHNGAAPFINPSDYTAKAINTIEIDCPITPNGYLVELVAGTEIRLTDGFESGDNFIARVRPCISNNQRTSNPNNNTITKPYAVNNNNNNNNNNSTNNQPLTVSIYPNPTTDKFTVELNSSSVNSFLVKVVNIYGKIIYQTTQLKAKQFINLSQQANGIYFVHIISGEERVIKKVVKK